MELDDGSHMATVGVIQEKGAEDIIEEGWVVSASSVTVGVEIHF